MRPVQDEAGKVRKKRMGKECKVLLRIGKFVVAFLPLIALPAFSQVFYYHGRLLSPGGTPVNSANVDFRLEIRTPGPENCLLYSETQNKNLSSSDGYFTIGVNDGTGIASGFSLLDTFKNKSFTFAAGACDSGNSYTGTANDGRKWVLYFNLNDGNGWDSFPPEKIERTPFAIESLSVGGFQAQNLLRVENAGVPQSVSSITSANFTELLALIAGTSTQYMKPNGSANLNTTGNITASSISGTTVGTSSLQVYRSDNANKVTIQVPASLSPDYTLTLPSSAGASGQVLTTDGSGSLSWTTVNTAVSNQASLASGKMWIGDGSGKAQEQTLSGDATISNAGVLTLSNTGVSSGTYTKVTVDPTGRVTAGTSLLASDLPVVSTGKGGTGLSVLGTSNQILGVNSAGSGLEYKSITAGSGVTVSHSAGGVQISATGSGGTVTSVDVSVPSTVFAASGGPITGSGTISLSLSPQNQFTVFAGPNGSASATPTFRFLNISDIRNQAGTGSFLNQSGACGAGKSLGHNSVTDTLECQTFTVTAAQATTALASASSVGIGTGSPSATLQVAGSMATAFASKSSNYTLSATDSIVAANASGGAVTMTLPSASGIAGRQYTIKKIDSSSNAVTVTTTGGQTIDGTTSYSLASQWNFLTLVSDGSNWLVTAFNGGTTGVPRYTSRMLAVTEGATSNYANVSTDMSSTWYYGGSASDFITITTSGVSAKLAGMTIGNYAGGSNSFNFTMYVISGSSTGGAVLASKSFSGYALSIGPGQTMLMFDSPVTLPPGTYSIGLAWPAGFTNGESYYFSWSGSVRSSSTVSGPSGTLSVSYSNTAYSGPGPLGASNGTNGSSNGGQIQTLLWLL